MPANPDRYLSLFGQRSCSLPALNSYSAVYTVRSLSEMKAAYAKAIPGSAIVFPNGRYPVSANERLAGNGGSAGAPVTIRPESMGGVTFTGTMTLRFEGGHTTYTGFNHKDVTTSDVYLLRHDGSYGKFLCNNFTNIVSGSGIGMYGHDGEVADNKFDRFTLIGVWQPSKLPNLTGLTPRLRNWYHHNTFKNSTGQGTALMIGYAAYHPGGSSSLEDAAGAVLEWNLFDGPQADNEYISIKSDANVIRYNYFRNAGSDNHLSIRMGHNNLAYGNLFTHPNGGYVVRTSGHNFTFLYNMLYGTGNYMILNMTHGEIASLAQNRLYYSGYNGTYRKNVLAGANHYNRTLSTYKGTTQGPSPSRNVFSENIWGHTAPPQYLDASGIAPEAWFLSNNTVDNSALMAPIGPSQFQSSNPIKIDMNEVIVVPNPILGPITVDPSTIPWLRDTQFSN